MLSSEPILNESKQCKIPKLTHTNYDEWRDYMGPLLVALRAYEILTGDEPELQALDLDHNGNYDDWKANNTQTTSILRLSCSPEVECIAQGIPDPQEMWCVLETRLYAARCYMGSLNILHQFCTC
jgi:hypothetical protein